MAIPKVTVTNVGHTRSEQWETWKAECECGWSYDNIAKSDVQLRATWHRKEHRAAQKASS